MIGVVVSPSKEVTEEEARRGGRSGFLIIWLCQSLHAPYCLSICGSCKRLLDKVILFCVVYWFHKGTRNSLGIFRWEVAQQRCFPGAVIVELARVSESLRGFDGTMHRALLPGFWISENWYPCAAASLVTTPENLCPGAHLSDSSQVSRAEPLHPRSLWFRPCKCWSSAFCVCRNLKKITPLLCILFVKDWTVKRWIYSGIPWSKLNSLEPANEVCITMKISSCLNHPKTWVPLST